MFVAVYTTFASIEDAKAFGRKIVEERLGACVNILPNIISIYRWKENIEEEPEVVVWMKTREVLVQKVKTVLKSIHPYDLPAFAVYKIDTGSEEYLQWLSEETMPLNIDR